MKAVSSLQMKLVIAYLIALSDKVINGATCFYRYDSNISPVGNTWTGQMYFEDWNDHSNNEIMQCDHLANHNQFGLLDSFGECKTKCLDGSYPECNSVNYLASDKKCNLKICHDPCDSDLLFSHGSYIGASNCYSSGKDFYPDPPDMTKYQSSHNTFIYDLSVPCSLEGIVETSGVAIKNNVLNFCELDILCGTSGCTDINSPNYNAAAVHDDGSCIKPGPADRICATGVPHNNGACCTASCGTCGGSGCSQRPGGSTNCCSGTILASEISCDFNMPPCVLSGSSTCELSDCSDATCWHYAMEDQAIRRGNPDICGYSGECLSGVTRQDAEDHCASLGMRLCTVCELLNDETRGSGCNFDKERIWTSTSCNGFPDWYYTGAGSTAKTDIHPTQCTDATELHQVRCCIDTDDDTGSCNDPICDVGIYGRTEWPHIRLNGVYYLTEIVANSRPVYIGDTMINYYLFYKGGSWIVGEDYTKSDGIAYHNSDVTHAHGIFDDDRSWNVWDGNNWVGDENVLLDCAYREYVGIYGRSGYPENVFDGVYYLNYNYTSFGRPVYDHENSDEHYFYVNNHWVVGDDIGTNNGVAFHPGDAQSGDLLTDEDNSAWVVWNGNSFVEDSNVITDSAYCNIFSSGATGWNADIINREYQIVLDQTAYGRPVFKRGSYYIFYHGDKWIIGPTVGSNSAVAYHSDDNISPNLINNVRAKWTVWTSDGWEQQEVENECTGDTIQFQMDIDFGSKLLLQTDPTLPEDFDVYQFLADVRIVLNVTHIPWTPEDFSFDGQNLHVVVRLARIEQLFWHFGVDNPVDLCWEMKSELLALPPEEVPASFPPLTAEMQNFDCAQDPPTLVEGETLIIPNPNTIPRSDLDAECVLWGDAVNDTYLLGYPCGIQRSYTNLDYAKSQCCECDGCNGIVQDGDKYYLRAGNALRQSVTGEKTIKRGGGSVTACTFSESQSGFLAGYACGSPSETYIDETEAQRVCCDCEKCGGYTCMDGECTLRRASAVTRGTSEQSFVKNPVVGAPCLLSPEIPTTYLRMYACNVTTPFYSLEDARAACCQCDTCGGVVADLDDVFTIREGTEERVSYTGERAYKRLPSSTISYGVLPGGNSSFPAPASGPSPAPVPGPANTSGEIPAEP